MIALRAILARNPDLAGPVTWRDTPAIRGPVTWRDTPAIRGPVHLPVVLS